MCSATNFLSKQVIMFLIYIQSKVYYYTGIICLHQLSQKTSGPNKQLDAQHLLFFSRLTPPLRHEGQKPRLLYNSAVWVWRLRRFGSDLHVIRVTELHRRPSSVTNFWVRLFKAINAFDGCCVTEFVLISGGNKMAAPCIFFFFLRQVWRFLSCNCEWEGCRKFNSKTNTDWNKCSIFVVEIESTISNARSIFFCSPPLSSSVHPTCIQRKRNNTTRTT